MQTVCFGIAVGALFGAVLRAQAPAILPSGALGSVSGPPFGDVLRARKSYFGSVNSPESHGFFYERGKVFWGEKKRTMGRKSFEGVCIKWPKRKKEKKGRQECYAMQMAPKEVLMDQWHGGNGEYIVAIRRNIKYLRRKGRFPINLRNE